MKKTTSLFVLALLLFFVSCSKEEVSDDFQLEEAKTTLLQQLSSTALMASKRPQPPIWADCIVYSGIVVPATFKPESDPFDELYALPEGYTYQGGVPLISESKPGDQDYNGGRWHLNVLKESVDPSKYADACSPEELDLNDFMSTDNYFGCPIRPRKN